LGVGVSDRGNTAASLFNSFSILAAQDSGTVTFGISNASGNRGTNVYISVSVDLITSASIASMTAYLDYDPAVLQFVSIKQGDISFT